VRGGLRSALTATSTIEVIGEAGDGRALLRQVAALRPDVVVMDIGMPELNGIDATSMIRRRYPATRVLMLSVHVTEPMVVAAIEAGATGYVTKETAGVELRQAVEAVSANLGYFSPSIAGLVAERIGHPRASAQPETRLSTREREVVQLISEGRRLDEIARRLFISKHTVRRTARTRCGRSGCAPLPSWFAGRSRMALRPERVANHPWPNRKDDGA
jgi:two-component system, NarL family, response regulator NreC